MFTASAYKLNTYRQCPRKYKYVYLDHLADQYKEAKPYLTMGAHVHNTLHDVYERLSPAERKVEKIEHLLRQRWTENRDGFNKDRQEEQRWGLKALNMIRLFVKESDLNKTPVMLEDYYDAYINPRLKIIGRIDRVDEEEGGLHVVDYKTGQENETKENLQLLLYGLIIQNKTGKEVNKASYLYLANHRWYTVSCSEEDYREAAQQVVAQVKVIQRDRKFDPKQNSFCGNCEFRRLCPTGQKVIKKIDEQNAQNIFAAPSADLSGDGA